MCCVSLAGGGVVGQRSTLEALSRLYWKLDIQKHNAGSGLACANNRQGQGKRLFTDGALSI